MTNQPKPAPTAEEQPLELPPLDVATEDKRSSDKCKPGTFEAILLERLNCRERQLLVALRSNREKDARIAELEKIVRTGSFYPPYKAATERAEAAEAKLRAVSDALDDGEQFDDIRLARIRAIVEGK